MSAIVMRCLLHVVAFVGSVALQKQNPLDPLSIDSMMDNIEGVLADKEKETLDDIQKKITEVNRQKAHYEQRLVTQRERIRAIQGENRDLLDELTATEESIEPIHKNATSILKENKEISNMLKMYEHNISIALAFAVASVNQSVSQLRSPAAQFVDDLPLPGSKNPKLSKLLSDDSKGAKELIADIASSPFDATAENETMQKFSDSFEELMNETKSYYEDLLQVQEALKGRLGSDNVMKANLSAAMQSLNEKFRNQLVRVNALRAFGKTLNGTADLPKAIANFATRFAASSSSEEEKLAAEEEPQESLTAEEQPQRPKRRTTRK